MAKAPLAPQGLPFEHPAVGKPQKPKSRALAILLSSGLWLLYFDLLTSAPGCTGSSETPGAQVDAGSADAVVGVVGLDAAPDALAAPDAPVAPSLDADLLDASSLDADLLDASSLDAAGVDGDSLDGSSVDSALDASIVDSGVDQFVEGVDAAVDASLGNPATGYVVAIAQTTSMSIQAVMGAAESSINAAIAPLDYDHGGAGLAVGTCGTYNGPSSTLVFSADHGQTMQLKDGANVVTTLGLINNIYLGSVSPVPASKSLSLDAFASATLTPTLMADLVVTPADYSVSAPAPGATVTKNVDLTLTWTPFSVESFVVRFGTAVAPRFGCRLDPSAGTFVVPAARTALLISGTESVSFIAINRRTVNVTLGGAKTVRGYAKFERARTVTVP